MNGADYVATVRLSNRENETLALPGETCERVPAESLGWLVEQGLITKGSFISFGAGVPVTLHGSERIDQQDVAEPRSDLRKLRRKE